MKKINLAFVKNLLYNMIRKGVIMKLNYKRTILVGFAFFIGLTIFVTFNDIVRDLSIF